MEAKRFHQERSRSGAALWWFVVVGSAVEPRIWDLILHCTIKGGCDHSVMEENRYRTMK
jgi:hypothetical protein